MIGCAASRWCRLLPVLLAAAPLFAQEKLRVTGPSPALLRLGDEAQVDIVVEGKDANPQPFELPKVDGLTTELSAPMRSSSYFFDGRNAVETVTVSYRLSVRPQREGVFELPPFRINTGTRDQLTPSLRIEARRDTEGEKLGWIEVKAEPRRVYVNEPVRIDVDFGMLQALRVTTLRANTGQPVFDVEVTADWLDKPSFGDLIDLPQSRNGQQLIVRDNRPYAVDYESDFARGGEQFHHFTMHRAVVPTRTGTFTLAAPSLRYQIVRREGQVDFFGQRRGGLTEDHFAKGEPITIEVLPIPEAGRPTPYFGAVGRGLTIDAALDRDSVKLGGSVKLTLTVRGAGNLEFLRMPDVDALPGFHKLGAAEAQRSADKVVVTYDLAPLNADVHEVPAIGWNFFDTTPGAEKFVSVPTKALPLTVKPMDKQETLAPLPDAAVKAIAPGVDDVYDLPSFDDEPRRAAALPRWLSVLAVLLPWLAAVVGLVAFRRARAAAADVQGQRVRGALRGCRQALDRGDDPLDALAGYVADRLGTQPAAVIAPDLRERLLASRLDAALADEVVRAIESGTAARYGAGAKLEAAQVRDLTTRLEGQRSWAPCWLPLLLLPLMLAGGRLPAQQAPPQDVARDAAAAVASYRAGDYRHAAAAFTALFERTGDRRFLMANGNCWFRLDDLPRALWAYESARLGMPRDGELLADIALVRKRLQLDDGADGFVAELASLRARLSPVERAWWCALGMSMAAGCFVFGWRRVGLRWIGALVLLPSLGLAVDVLGFVASPKQAVALQRVEVVSEPRTGLPALATVQPGVVVEVLGGEQGAFLRVAAGDRRGFVARDRMAIIE